MKGIILKKVILITLCSCLLLAGCSKSATQYQIKNAPEIASQEPAKPKPEPIKKAEPLKYTITKYNLMQYGDDWKYVLVGENFTSEELKEISTELHNKYPATCFKLFANIETLKLVYKYDSTDSYTTKQIPYPEKVFNRDNRGIINQMWNADRQDRIWSYTSQNYETIEL